MTKRGVYLPTITATAFIVAIAVIIGVFAIKALIEYSWHSDRSILVSVPPEPTIQLGTSEITPISTPSLIKENVVTSPILYGSDRKRTFTLTVPQEWDIARYEYEQDGPGTYKISLTKHGYSLSMSELSAYSIGPCDFENKLEYGENVTLHSEIATKFGRLRIARKVGADTYNYMACQSTTNGKYWQPSTSIGLITFNVADDNADIIKEMEGILKGIDVIYLNKTLD